jgi:hypothetical protein
MTEPESSAAVFTTPFKRDAFCLTRGITIQVAFQSMRSETCRLDYRERMIYMLEVFALKKIICPILGSLQFR